MSDVPNKVGKIPFGTFYHISLILHEDDCQELEKTDSRSSRASKTFSNQDQVTE